MSRITLVENDVNFPIEFILKDADGDRIDLTNYTTVKFRMALLGATTCQAIGDCSVTDAADGECYYTVVTDDLDTVGIFESTIKITYDSGRVITARGLTVCVVPELPAT